MDDDLHAIGPGEERVAADMCVEDGTDIAARFENIRDGLIADIRVIARVYLMPVPATAGR